MHDLDKRWYSSIFLILSTKMAFGTEPKKLNVYIYHSVMCSGDTLGLNFTSAGADIVHLTLRLSVPSG